MNVLIRYKKCLNKFSTSFFFYFLHPSLSLALMCKNKNVYRLLTGIKNYLFLVIILKVHSARYTYCWCSKFGQPTNFAIYIKLVLKSIGEKITNKKINKVTNERKKIQKCPGRVVRSISFMTRLSHR